MNWSRYTKLITVYFLCGVVARLIFDEFWLVPLVLGALFVYFFVMVCIYGAHLVFVTPLLLKYKWYQLSYNELDKEDEARILRLVMVWSCTYVIGQTLPMYLFRTVAPLDCLLDLINDYFRKIVFGTEYYRGVILVPGENCSIQTQ